MPVAVIYLKMDSDSDSGLGLDVTEPNFNLLAQHPVLNKHGPSSTHSHSMSDETGFRGEQ